eukprot:scaffold86640_cov31-Phaeocystis_antarctica.AAC.1
MVAPSSNHGLIPRLAEARLNRVSSRLAGDRPETLPASPGFEPCVAYGLGWKISSSSAPWVRVRVRGRRARLRRWSRQRNVPKEVVEATYASRLRSGVITRERTEGGGRGDVCLEATSGVITRERTEGGGRGDVSLEGGADRLGGAADAGVGLVGSN